MKYLQYYLSEIAVVLLLALSFAGGAYFRSTKNPAAKRKVWPAFVVLLCACLFLIAVLADLPRDKLFLAFVALVFIATVDLTFTKICATCGAMHHDRPKLCSKCGQELLRERP